MRMKDRKEWYEEWVRKDGKERRNEGTLSEKRETGRLRNTPDLGKSQGDPSNLGRMSLTSLGSESPGPKEQVGRRLREERNFGAGNWQCR